MSQWGQERVIDGCCVIPRVASCTWEPAQPWHLIDELFVVHGGAAPEAARALIGQTYSTWLTLPK